ncbi:MAG TPA: pyridoxal phosphate-dependent aminotransferase [Candidatus Polarisedimenticolia bacterium]|nr:pyridoxal phosphate-dependent aminotransferase [Candidatus Polarisedimenticolia bacterium]
MKQCAYMAWAKAHAPARYNLANSGLVACTSEEFPIAGETIPIQGVNPDGWPPLKEAIASTYGVGTDQVVLAQGTSGANFLALASLVERDDEVLIERPVYEPLLSAAQFLGAKVKRFSRTLEGRYRIDVDALRGLLTPRTRLIVMTSPHNPSGVVADPADLAALGDLASEAGIPILLDEVYRDSLFEEAPPSAATLGEAFVATNSLTKSYGLSGLRCGWILASPTRAEKMRRLHDLMAATGPMPTEAMGCLAFARLPALAARSRSILEPNRRRIGEFMAEHDDLLEAVVPPRSMTVFPRLKGSRVGEDLLERLRARATSIVPGRFFEEPRHFRIGFGIRPADLEEGLRRVSEALRELS